MTYLRKVADSVLSLAVCGGMWWLFTRYKIAPILFFGFVGVVMVKEIWYGDLILIGADPDPKKKETAVPS